MKNKILMAIVIVIFVGCGANDDIEKKQVPVEESDSLEYLINNCTSVYMRYGYSVKDEGSTGDFYELEKNEDVAKFTFRGYTNDSYEERGSDFTMEKYNELVSIIGESEPSLYDVNSYADENGKINYETLDPAIELLGCYSEDDKKGRFLLSIGDTRKVEDFFVNLKENSDITYSENEEQSIGYLDLESESNGDNNDVLKLVDYQVNEGATMTINLKDSGDGSLHYAVLAVSLSQDSTNEDYTNKFGGSGDLKAYDSIICDTIKTVVADHTIDDMRNNEAKVKEEIVESLQSLFKSSFIVRVNFSSATYQ